MSQSGSSTNSLNYMKEEENANTEFEKVLLIAHFVFLGHIKFAVRIFCAHNAFCREKEDMMVYDQAINSF